MLGLICHGRRNRGGGGAGGANILPTKIKSLKITTHKSVYSNKAKIGSVDIGNQFFAPPPKSPPRSYGLVRSDNSDMITYMIHTYTLGYVVATLTMMTWAHLHYTS